MSRFSWTQQAVVDVMVQVIAMWPYVFKPPVSGPAPSHCVEQNHEKGHGMSQSEAPNSEWSGLGKDDKQLSEWRQAAIDWSLQVEVLNVSKPDQEGNTPDASPKRLLIKVTLWEGRVNVNWAQEPALLQYDGEYGVYNSTNTACCKTAAQNAC